MGIGPIIVEKGGSAAAPETLSLSLPTPDDYRATDHGPLSVIGLPYLRALMWGNGHDQLRHIVTNVLKTGILAPEVGPTLAPTGVPAIYDLDCDANSGAPQWDTSTSNEEFLMFLQPPASSALGLSIQSVPTLGTGVRHFYALAEVQKGASDADTAENLTKFINQSGVDGVHYTNPRNPTTGALLYEWLPDRYFTATRASAVVTVTHRRSGTLGNGMWNSWNYSTGGAATEISDTATQTGTDGTGDTPEAGIHNYAFRYHRTEDFAYSGASPKTEIEIDAGMQVDLSAMAAPDDPDDDVDFIQIERTGIEGEKLFRVAQQDEDTATYSDTLDLATLLTRTHLDPNLRSMYAGGYPPRGRCLAPYKNRVYTAGARIVPDYSAGTAAVTNADNEVVLTDGYPTVSWIGREFEVDGDGTRYPIVRVDASAKKLYLARNYEGSNDATASYTVKDLRDPYELFNSEPGLPNAWPGNSDRGATSPTPDGVLALTEAFGGLAVHTRTSFFSYLSEDGSIPQFHKESDEAGCAGPIGALEAGGILYWLGKGGVYAWPGAGEPLNIAAPPLVNGEPIGIQSTLRRLNERQLDQVVAHYDENEKIIRWAVPLDDDVTNRHMIIFDLNARVFTVDECEDITAIGEVEFAGTRHILAGDVHGNVFELGVGENDGAFGFEGVQTVTASDVRSVTVGGTPFPTASDGLKGLPVYGISATGDFVRVKVASNTTSKIVFTTHLDAAFAVGTQIVVGGILWDPETGRWHAGELRDEKGLVAVTLGFVPQDRGQMWVCSAINQGDPSLEVGVDLEVDLTTETGKWVAYPGQHGDLQKQRFVCIGNNFTPKLHALEYEVQYRERR